MDKTLLILLKIIRWIFGIIFSLASIGGFANGDTIFAIIVLFLGLILIPPIGKWFFGLFPSKLTLPDFSINLIPNKSSKFIKELDLQNDPSLIKTIDNHFNSQEKTISEKRKNIIGKRIYKRTLDLSLSDLHLSEKEKLKLQEIIEYFNFSPKEIKVIKDSLNTKAIENLVKKAYDDKILSEKEQNEIIELAKYLELPEISIEKIKVKVTSSLLQVAFNDKLKDKRLTPKEETELNELLTELQIDKTRIDEIIPQKNLKQLAYAKLLWSLENGIFYNIPNPSIILKKKEECYLSLWGQVLERKTVHKGYSYNNSSISIPIAKGVRFNTGGGRAKPMKQEVTIKHSGSLVLTNLRIVFSASGSKSFQIPFTKLLSFNVFSDGIEFILDRKSHLVSIPSKDVDLFAVGLTSSIRNFLDDENKITSDAIKEIEANDTFIKI